jgi:hypothetical protein
MARNGVRASWAYPVGLLVTAAAIPHVVPCKRSVVGSSPSSGSRQTRSAGHRERSVSFRAHVSIVRRPPIRRPPHAIAQVKGSTQVASMQCVHDGDRRSAAAARRSASGCGGHRQARFSWVRGVVGPHSRQRPPRRSREPRVGRVPARRGRHEGFSWVRRSGGRLRPPRRGWGRRACGGCARRGDRRS